MPQHIDVARKLRGNLTPDWGMTGAFQWGKVGAVHTATVDVYLDGSASLTTGLPYLSAYTPRVNDVVVIARMQGRSQSARVVIGTQVGGGICPVSIFAAGNAVVGSAPAAASGGFLLQAGQTVATTSASGGFNIALPSGFPNGMLTALVWNGNNNHTRNVVLGVQANMSASQINGVVYDSSTGGSVNNTTITFNWMAIGF